MEYQRTLKLLCGLCLGLQSRLLHFYPRLATCCTSVEFDMMMTAVLKYVYSQAKTTTLAPPARRQSYVEFGSNLASTDPFDVILLSRDETTGRWTDSLNGLTGLQHQQPEMSTFDGYLQDRFGSEMPTSTTSDSTTTGSGCAVTTIGVC